MPPAQARLDEEAAALARRQQVFARDRDQMSASEEGEYERAAQEALFRCGSFSGAVRTAGSDRGSAYGTGRSAVIPLLLLLFVAVLAVT